MNFGPRSFSSLLLVLPLVTTGCGSVVPTGAAGDTLSAACDRFAAQRAAYESRCPEFSFGHPDDPDPAATAASCVGVATAPGSLLTVADVDTCTEALGGACVIEGLYPSCVGYGANQLYPGHDRKGSLPPGEPCVADLQCDTGYCGGTSYLGGECGVCVVPRAHLESCAGPFDQCIGDTTCTAGTCQLAGFAEGEKCVDKGQECQADLFCAYPDPSVFEGVCTPRGAAGDPCADNRPCADGLFCGAQGCAPLLPDGASCGPTDGCRSSCIEGACRPITAVGQGERCDFDMCGPGLMCNEDLVHPVCVPETYLPVGSACSTTEALPCTPGQICNAGCFDGNCPTTGACVDLPTAGQPCGFVMACAPGHICEGFAPAMNQPGTCTRLGSVGEACPCPVSLTCMGGKCVPYGAGLCQ